jgi:hypothetical protein
VCIAPPYATLLEMVELKMVNMPELYIAPPSSEAFPLVNVKLIRFTLTLEDITKILLDT